MATSATFVIDFGSVENAFLVVELDSVKNSEKTSFQSGDEVFFKIYSNSNYQIEITAGTVTDGLANVEEQITDEVISFVKGDTATTQKKIKITSALQTTWFGNNLGTLSIADVNKVRAASADSDSLGIAFLTYTSEYNEHSIVPPESMSSIYRILVYIKAIA